MLRAWKNELEPLLKNEADQTTEDKQQIGIFRQCRRYIKPLLKLLEKNVFDFDRFSLGFERRNNEWTVSYHKLLYAKGVF